MGFYHPATLVKDAQRHGVRVLPIEVNSSEWSCIVSGKSFRIGLRFVRGLAQASAQALVQARAAGPFRSIGEVQRRCPQLGAAELTTLAEIGAFAGLAEKPTRRDALWQVSELVNNRGGLLAEASDPRSPLPAMSLAERIAADYHGTSISVGPHPLALERQALREHGVVCARELGGLAGGRLVRVAGLVIVRQRPPTARGFFFLTLEDESGLLNLIVSPPVFDQYRPVLLSAVGLVVDGQLQRERDAVSVKGLRFQDLAVVLGGVAAA
jgi:error-prone DNA polymerase